MPDKSKPVMKPVRAASSVHMITDKEKADRIRNRRDYVEFAKQCDNAPGPKPTIWRKYSDGTEECMCQWCKRRST